MRLVGGPFDGRYQTVTGEVGEQLLVPGRNEVDKRWHDVDHIYEVQEDGTALYCFSQYEHKMVHVRTPAKEKV